MNLSGSRATEDINLDEFERRLRAAGAQHANAEDPLLELARLIESSRFGQSGSGLSQQAAPESALEAQASIEPQHTRSAIEAEDLIPSASDADRDARQDFEFHAPRPHESNAGEIAPEARSSGWKLKVSALALAGVAMIGAVFALKGGVPGLPKQPPFIAAAHGPTKVQPPTDETVTASNDAGASLLKDSAKPVSANVLSSEEQPVDLSAQASLRNPAPAPAIPAVAADQPKPPAGVNPVAATVDTPLVAPPAPPPSPIASDFPDPKPVRTVSLRPDGTPIAAPSPNQGGNATPASAGAPPKPPANAASKTQSDAAGVAQPSTPKIELPAKLSTKSSSRVVVAKTDTTAPEASAPTPAEPAQAALPIKTERAAKKSKPEADATPAAPAVDATASTASGGWSVQLAAPKSEAEAKSEAARLTGKYGADLNGSPIAVRKTVVNGETIYRLRVVGFTKADAAALCARLKGDGGECFIAK